VNDGMGVPRCGVGRGRPVGTSKDTSYKWRSVGLTQADWDWLDLWFPGQSPGASSLSLRELVERARKFWPNGPNKFR